MTPNDPTDVPTIQAVVFDMGGVVVKLASLADVLAGADLSPEEIWERWILSDAVRSFEGGHCGVHEFADQLIGELGVELDRDELIERFMNFPQGLYDGAEAMVAAVRDRVTTGVLSNTNGLHWEQQIDHERIQPLFDKRYLSYEMGLLKPDAAIYEAVVADLGLPAAQVFFIDDNQVKVDGALAVGMQAALAKGPVEATAALRSVGVLPAP